MVPMARILNVLALCLLAVGLLASCSTLDPQIYVPKVEHIQLANGNSADILDSWSSAWGSECGVLIYDKTGKVVQTIPGSCGTPLTLFLNTPMNYGVGAGLFSGYHF